MAWRTSVDLKEGRGFSPHLVMDVNTFLDKVAMGAVQCDVLVAHPPCTLLSRYAAVHYGRMGKGRVDRARALGLITRLLRCMKTVAEVYVENPSRMCKISNVQAIWAARRRPVAVGVWRSL